MIWTIRAMIPQITISMTVTELIMALARGSAKPIKLPENAIAAAVDFSLMSSNSLCLVTAEYAPTNTITKTTATPKKLQELIKVSHVIEYKVAHHILPCGAWSLCLVSSGQISTCNCTPK